MSYLVIARRFRPQTFASIVGQEHVSRALANAIIRDRLAHALLFSGPRGVGKTTAARVLARALNCTGRDLSELKGMEDAAAREFIEPCGECANCLEIAKGSSLSCREVDGASNNSVDNVRELIESLRTLPPPGSQYKIYLIDEVHMLSTAAFNALLKSLEEPPPNTIFIFATTDPQKIPETVLSRCQQFDFRRLPTEVVIDSLKRIAVAEDVVVDDAVYRLIARKAQGGMRDAQSLLDRLLAFSEREVTLAFAQEVFGVADGRALVNLISAVLAGDPAEAIRLVEEIFSRSLDVRGFVADFISTFRALYLLSIASAKRQLAEMLDIETLNELALLASEREGFDLQRLYQLSQEVGDKALQSSFPRFVIEAGVARMAALPSLRPLAEILTALSSESAPVERVAAARKEAPKVAAKPAPEAPREELASFNPRWTNFVSHVSNSGNPLLAQFLRRVSARKFQDGRLEIEGSGFDISHLRESENLELLRKNLQSYIRGGKWELSLHETVPGNHVAAHSLVAQDEDRRRIKREEVNRDVHEDPLVQAALSTFSGSKIERINPLK